MAPAFSKMPELSKPDLLVVIPAGTPPGSGKSTFLPKLAERLGNVPVVSSDNYQKRDNFEKALKKAIYDNSTVLENPKIDKETSVVLCDKNFPNFEGIKRLLKVLADVASYFDQVFLVKICPESLGKVERDCIDTRLKKRVPQEGKTVLCPQTQKFESVLNRFWKLCTANLERFQQSPGTVVTNGFFQEDPGFNYVEDIREYIMGGPSNWMKISPAPVRGFWSVELDSDKVISQLNLTDSIPDGLVLKRKFHVTLSFNPTGEEHSFMKTREGKEVPVHVTRVAYDDKAMAAVVTVELDDLPIAKNRILHITLALKQGTKPFYSATMLKSKNTKMGTDCYLNGCIKWNPHR